MSDLLKRDEKVVWHPFAPFKGGYPTLPLKAAKGMYLELEDGRKIMDAVSSWWVNLYGHSRPELIETLTKQYDLIDHVIFSGFTHEPAVKLGELLCEKLPGEMKRIFFSDDGSTSVEVGIKMALQYHHNIGKAKNKIVSIEGAYHGDTFGVMSAAGKNDFFKAFNDLFFDIEQIPLPNNENEDHVIDQFTKICESGKIAGFVFEPLIQGSAGMRIYPARILNKLCKIARANDVIIIADEVMTGFGRTGEFVAVNHLTTEVPDIICLSKGITGGILPLGVTMANTKIEAGFQSADIDKVFYHGHSYTACALTCALAETSIKLFFSEEIQNQISKVKSWHKEYIDSFKFAEKVTRIESLGTILAIEVKQNDTSYFSALKYKIYDFFMSKNILLSPLGNVIYIMAPYVINQEEMLSVYEAIDEFFAELN